MAVDNDAGDQLPLQGVVLCCTSLAQDVRVSLSRDQTIDEPRDAGADVLLKTKIANVATQMGAVHKLDLTTDVTHLLVGDIATAKYRYVAKERPDIRVLSPDFIDAVRVLWMEGGDVDVEFLEKQHAMPTFYGLQVCLTGFEDLETRKQMEDTIEAQGGHYNRDLTKQVTHLIAAKPEGAKYTYAKQWGINVVGAKWYDDCVLRGMALEETFYPPELPIAKQGIGAFRVEPRRTSLGKRERDEEQAAAGDARPRKLRKAASARLDSQSRNMWNDMSQSNVQVDTTELDAWGDESQTLRESITQPPSRGSEATDHVPTEEVTAAHEPDGLFAGQYVMLHGFEASKAQLLQRYLEPNGATVVKSSTELEAASNNPFFKQRCLLMPHAQPVALPDVPAGTILVTEWWVERCLHHKQHIDPQEDPLSSPLTDALIPAFASMTISTTGFDSVDLRQTAEVVKLMGATYQESLAPSTSVLVCAAQKVKREKAYYANKHKIPVVSPDWLWTSLKTKKRASIEQYRIPLPACDTQDEFADSTAESTAQGAVSELNRSDGAIQRANDLMPSKRLSNTRRRHATPSLVLKASAPAAPGTSEPKQPLSRRAPFIHEDEEQEDNANAAEQHAFEPGPSNTADLDLPPSFSQPLRELSPNASSRSARRPSKDSDHDFECQVKRRHQAAHDKSSDLVPEGIRRRQSMENRVATPEQSDDLANKLASLIEQRKASHPEPSLPEPQKRKHRPLGRNPSGTSTLLRRPASSTSASPALPAQMSESMSEADGFYVARETSPQPPSTQLGYATAEVEAHRLQMAKKMGTSLWADEGGTRVANVATVKDSEEISARSAKAAVASRAKGRSRTKA